MQIKILIVDDDVGLLNALGRTFTTMLQGYLVLTATTANAGLTMLKDQQPDVVILDVRLGSESGMDLLKDFYGYLAARRIQRKPRFIVITAYLDPEIKRLALETYKVEAFLEKPFDPAEIRRKVVEAILKVLDEERRSLSFYATQPNRTSKEIPREQSGG